MSKVLLIIALCLWPAAAIAALTPAALNSAGVDLPANAVLPLNLVAPDLSGDRRSIASALAGKPGFAIFADYTCKTLCGPALVLLTAGLTQSALPPGSWRLIVIGLDPKDSAEDARRMLLAQVPERLRPQTVFLLPDARTVAAATKALGFRYVYDKSVDQFAHPEVAYAIAADGRVLRVLSPLALTASDLRNALSSPPQPAESLYGKFRVLCYRFGLLTGIYDIPVQIALKVAAILTLALMALGLLMLIRSKRSWT
jgi:protein SCO1/2